MAIADKGMKEWHPVGRALVSIAPYFLLFSYEIVLAIGILFAIAYSLYANCKKKKINEEHLTPKNFFHDVFCIFSCQP